MTIHHLTIIIIMTAMIIIHQKNCMDILIMVKKDFA